MNRSDRSVSVAASIVCAGAAVVVVLAACSDRQPFADTTTPAFDPLDATAPESPPATCGVHCSRDLKEVLDGCEGAETLIQRCNADQGCGDGKCVDACTAAVLTKGSAGCDFWTVPPDSPFEGRGGCFAAMIANTWDRGVTISAELGAANLDISKATYTVDRSGQEPIYTRLDGPLAPGQVAIVFFAHDDTNHEEGAARCPPTVTPAMLVDAAKHGTGIAKAFHIKTNAPVSAYSIYPYGGAESFVPTATLLLPVSSWTRSYVAVSPFDFGNTQRRRSLQIVASEDDTEVSIKPTVEIAAGGGVAGATTGVTQTWKLSKGEVLQFLQASTTGSPIETSRPVGVFGGAECTELPTPYCDTLQQQIPPFEQWGTEYAVVPFQPRVPSFSASVREQVPYTLVGAIDGTTLTYEPSRPRDAPETLAAGESASFITDEIFVVKSQDSKHPFHVNVYMTGSTYGGGTGARTTGDPDFVNVPPTDQYLDRYVFFTDFTFPDTTLTVVRRKTAKGFVPVELACGGEIAGFQPLGTSGKYEFAWVRLTSGFVPQTIAPDAGTTCSYGRQEARSTGPFAVTVWGMGIDASYGYVGGTGLRPINDAKAPTVK
ncbi:MAG: IgGFc-binding protein [Labilithrix sp.]|nr:IgGFc-binding protein [Labilithrix sp.]